ncbi:DUF4349 domain-containing protein [Streptomyces sp. NPDC101733]|uniref:DUF4349 domain-containing protein n=1 Tax=unclassified Streptomyces TaxID=2593676 RepID=UPI00382BA285
MHALHRHRTAAALAGLSMAAALALTGCAGDSGAASDKAAVAPADRGEAAPAQPGGAGAAAPQGSAGADSKAGQAPAAIRQNVIRTGALALETTTPEKVLASARTAAGAAGGYVGKESTERDADGRVTSTLTLRVPGERYDAVLASLQGDAKLLSRKVDEQDVTQKVADVDSRVKSQQASVTRVREMMEKASGLSDVVMLEAELSRRQAELESLLAQQNALKDQTSLGTITLTVSQPAPEPVAPRDEPEPGFTDALHGGWSVFTRIVRYLGLALAAVLPFALAAGLVAAGFRGYRRLRPAKPKTGLTPTWVPRQTRVPAGVGAGVGVGSGAGDRADGGAPAEAGGPDRTGDEGRGPDRP